MRDDPILLHRMARNYLACVYPFPAGLRPEHLRVPRAFEGLRLLHRAISDVYEAFARVEIADARARSDENYCWKVLDGSAFLLWTMGVLGERGAARPRVDYRVSRAALSTSAPGRRLVDGDAIVSGLSAAGFRLTFLNADGSACASGWKRCQFVSLSWVKDSAQADAVWSALRLFARRVDFRRRGVPFEAFQRADFRSLLPEGDPAVPPYTLDEALQTLDVKTADLWRDMADCLARRYPKYVPFFRHPDLRRRTWAVNYDTHAKGYGLFTLYGEDGGLRVRMALRKTGRAYVLSHIDELSPRMQEMFLERVSCTDCKHCGKHESYAHGDHQHRLCAGAWFYSRHLEREDLPSVQRLIEIHVSHLR